MAYQKALDESEVRRANLKSIQTWIETNKSKIKAKPNKTICYAGLKLRLTDGLSTVDCEELKGTPMWKYIKEMPKQTHDAKFPGEFQTLEDVLKAIRTHPEFIDRDRQKLVFSSAFEFFNEVGSFPKLLLDSKKVSDDLWRRLSSIYVSNATGDIEILDGVSEYYDKLSKEKILINTELPALLKGNKLSPAGKEKLLKKISEYRKEFDNRHTKLIQLLDKDVSRLKRQRP